MNLITRRTHIVICKEPTDMRLGFNGLQKKAKKVFKTNPYQGQFFVFVNRRRSSLKIYTYDGSGDVLICKRLSQGVFCRPNPSYKKQIRLTGSEFSQFFEGLNISGRILESSSHSSRRSKKLLRFVPPYRKLTPSDATGGINTRQSPPSSSSERG
jgi:transposase